MINTRIMNDFLLTKWIWKIMKGSEETWYKLLQAKYMPDGDFFKSRSTRASQFWQCLHKIKHLFKWGAIHKVGNGAKTFFWNDVWIGNVLLRINFPELFSMSRSPNARVSDILSNGAWDISFRRSLIPSENVTYNLLLQILSSVQWVDTDDKIEWALDKSKTFTTKSLYSFLTHRVVCVREGDSVWKAKVPLKIKFFLWQVDNNKL